MTDAIETRPEVARRCQRMKADSLTPRICGRVVHEAPEHDPEPVCLMHSNDPEKDDEQFLAEFDRILDEADSSDTFADFTGFVFPFADFEVRIFRPACRFDEATFASDAEFAANIFNQIMSFRKAKFKGNADFRGAIFVREVDFSEATFAQSVEFREATFAQNARFKDATFTKIVDFPEATFAQDARVRDATFTPGVNFSDVTFTQDADFFHSTFGQRAVFFGATFARRTDFGHATFAQSASFGRATFAQEAAFHHAIFTQGVDFDTAKFAQGAIFQEATFAQDANFTDTTFGQWASFHMAIVSEGMRFRDAKFVGAGPSGVTLVFTDAKLSHPEKVEFYKTDLSRAVFFNTDISGVDFTLAQWHKRGKSARFCLFEEVIEVYKHIREPEEFVINIASLEPIEGSYDERNYGLIAETYQQLKRNYDAKGDYWTAGHFHYGEMEMLRLHSRFLWKPLRWLAQNLSLTALYKYASAYGESMMQPLGWLAAMVVAFAMLFPLAGLEVNAKPGEQGLNGWQVDYWNARKFFMEHDSENPAPNWMRRITGDHAAVPLLVHSGMTALSVAGFQKELRYSPAYPGGRALGLFELLLTTTLAGLFLLAIRRQYKRS